MEETGTTVDQYFSPNPIMPDTAGGPENKSSGAIWVVLAAIILAAIGGAAFWYGSRGSTLTKSLPTPTPALTGLPTPTPPPAGGPSPSPSPKPSPKPTPKPTPKPSPTPTPTPVASPTPTPSPSPTPTPTPVTLAVTGVTAAVDHASAACSPTPTFTFTGTISANTAGTVTYKWNRSDGATDSNAPYSITFSTPGSQPVTTTWTTADPSTKWEQVEILTPNSLLSNQASFSCTP